jgi:hypothetical protein
MGREDQKVKSGDKVVLIELPPGLINGLPKKDQTAISDIVGKPIHLVDFDDDGRAVIEFVDSEGDIHFIYVAPNFLRPV